MSNVLEALFMLEKRNMMNSFHALLNICLPTSFLTHDLLLTLLECLAMEQGSQTKQFFVSTLFLTFIAYFE